MFTVALFIIAETLEAAQMSSSDWLKKLWYALYDEILCSLLKLWLVEIFTKRMLSWKAWCKTTSRFEFYKNTWVCLCKWKRLGWNILKCWVILSEKYPFIFLTIPHLSTSNPSSLINSASKAYPRYCSLFSIPNTAHSSEPFSSFTMTNRSLSLVSLPPLLLHYRPISIQ